MTKPPRSLWPPEEQATSYAEALTSDRTPVGHTCGDIVRLIEEAYGAERHTIENCPGPMTLADLITESNLSSPIAGHADA